MKQIEIQESIISCQDILGESPLWDHRRNALFWVDIDEGLIHSFKLETKETKIWSINEKVGCLAMHEDGGFILATESGLSLWDPESNLKNFFLPFKHSRPDNLFNDGKIDPFGRFWIGTKGPQGTSNLWTLQDGKLVVKISGLSISNGLDWSADGRFFYHTDSLEHTIYRYDINLETAELSNRIVFYKTENGTPDGLTIDSDGNIWTAIWDGWHVLQLSPAGEVLTEIRVPVQRPTSIAFGGEDLRSLFITSASEGISPSEREAQPFAGDIFAIQPGVAGRKASIAKKL
jgi:sugar lactone lactonase YvrE